MKPSLFLVLGMLHATSAPAHTMHGTYRVPVASPELEPYATYEVEYEADYGDTAPGDLRFWLPDVLTGDAHVTYSMRAVDGEPGHFVGPQVEGNCAVIERNLGCQVRFRDLQIDPARVESAVRKRFTDPGEIAGRLAVALAFASEPIGILNYPLTKQQHSEFTSNHIIFPQN